MEAKLKHDFSSVGLNGSDGYSQLHCRFLVRFSLGQQADDFNFTGRCVVICTLALPMPASCLEESLQHNFRHFRCEKTLALRNGFDSFDEVIGQVGLYQVSARAPV